MNCYRTQNPILPRLAEFAVPAPIKRSLVSRPLYGQMGQSGEALVATMGVGVIVGMIVLRAAGGYLVGSALTPKGKKKRTYAIVGSLLGFFLGPVGLGGMAYAVKK